MSEWYVIEKPEDVALSEDGETIEVLFNTNEWGNQYVDIPIEFVLELLKPQGE